MAEAVVNDSACEHIKHDRIFNESKDAEQTVGIIEAGIHDKAQCQSFPTALLFILYFVV